MGRLTQDQARQAAARSRSGNGSVAYAKTHGSVRTAGASAPPPIPIHRPTTGPCSGDLAGMPVRSVRPGSLPVVTRFVTGHAARAVSCGTVRRAAATGLGIVLRGICRAGGQWTIWTIPCKTGMSGSLAPQKPHGEGRLDVVCKHASRAYLHPHSPACRGSTSSCNRDCGPGSFLVPVRIAAPTTAGQGRDLFDTEISSQD